MQCPMKFFQKMLEKSTSISQTFQPGAFSGSNGRFLLSSAKNLEGKGWSRKKGAIEVQYNAWGKIINTVRL